MYEILKIFSKKYAIFARFSLKLPFLNIPSKASYDIVFLL